MKNNKISKELKKQYDFKSGSCYINADKLFKYKICKYIVVGFAKEKKSKIAFRHAWNMDEDFNIIDATLEKNIENIEYYRAFSMDLDTFYKDGVVFKCDGNDYRYYKRFEEIDCAVSNNLKLCDYDLYKYLYSEGTEIFEYECFDDDSSINLRAKCI